MVTPSPAGTATTGSLDAQPSTSQSTPDADNGRLSDDSSLTVTDASTSFGVPEAAALDGNSDATASPGTCAPGMVRIPAKNQSFMMGFDPAEAPGTIWACYLGKHQVTFTHDYCMDATLVTQDEFSKVMGFNPSKHKTADLTLPVDSETWYDAVLYCNKKSQTDGLRPGNLFEWEHDWEGPYPTTPEVDPLGPAMGTGCGSFGLGIQKMAKGGSWHTDVATHMRISYHFKWAPSATHAELGFRCVSTATK